jgi:SPP1 gp7 family putative phage head morphogenesis protein
VKNFKLNPKENSKVDKKYARKRKVIHAAVSGMEAIMAEAVKYILDNYDGTDRFPEPSLHKMYDVSAKFYRSVITEAYQACGEDKKGKITGNGKKKLAKLPLGLPKTLKGMEKVFRDKRYWPMIMKRSGLITDRMRRQYLDKLRKKFDQIVPDMRNGEITPKDAKKQLMDSWGASKYRVESIFRTETTTYFEKSQVAFFNDDPEIIGFLFDSLKDSGSTNICSSRHGLVYRPGTKLLADNTPSLHWGCRSHLIALANTLANRKMVDDPSRDPSKRSVTPLPKNWRK